MFFRKQIQFISIFIFTLTTSVFSQVDLPFDYFYGRWVDGHSFNAEFSYRKYDDPEFNYHDSDFRFISNQYLLTKKSWQVKVSDIGEYKYWNKDKHYTNIPILGIAYRVNDHWQVDLEDLKVSRYVRKNSPTTSHQASYYYDNIELGVKINSTWSNNAILQIDNRHAPFAYVGKNLFVSRSMIYECRLILDRRYNKSNRVTHSLPSRLLSATTSDDYESFRYSFYNKFMYGVTDDVNIIAQINLNADNSYSHDFRSVYHDDNSYRLNESYSTWNKKKLFYNLSFLVGLFSPLYIEAELYQDFNKIEGSRKVFNSSSDEPFSRIESLKDSGYLNDRTGTSLNLTYVSEGEFQKSVVLNDYNNYYKNMLFYKQLLLSLHTRYEQYGEGGSQNYDITNFTFNSSYGLHPKINIGGSLFYKYEKREIIYEPSIELKSENFYYSFNLKYRSYEFIENTSNNWAEDSKSDILLGPVLRAKQYYLNLVLTPPRYSGRRSTTTHLFGFNSLRHNGVVNLRIDVNVGMGEMTEFFLTTDHSFRNNTYDYYTYRFGLVKRLLHKIQFDLMYEKRGYTGLSSEVIVRGNVSLIL